MSWAQTIVGGGIGGAVAGGMFELVKRWLDKRDAATQRQRESDGRVLRKLLQAVPEREIRFLREQDFGGSWESDATRCVLAYYEYSRAKHPDLTLASSSLEPLRLAFVRSIGDWYRNVALRSVPHERLEGRQVVIPDERDDRDEWWESRQALNDTSAAVASAYDALMAAARRELPEAFAVDQRTPPVVDGPGDHDAV